MAGSGSNARVVDNTQDAVTDVSLEHMVEAITLDETLVDSERIDVIKMDIEGAEPRAWRGMPQIIEELRPVVVFEFSPEAIKLTSHVEPADFLEEVINKGYELFIINREEGRSPDPQKPEQIIQRHHQTGITHLDLIALPQK